MYAYRCFTWMWLLIHTVNPAGAGSVNPVNKRGPSDIWFVSITNCTYASVIHCHEKMHFRIYNRFLFGRRIFNIHNRYKITMQSNSPFMIKYSSYQFPSNFPRGLCIHFGHSKKRGQKVNPKQWTCCRCNRATSFNSPISYDYDLMDI